MAFLKKSKNNAALPTRMEDATTGSEGFVATTRTMAVSEIRNLKTIRVVSVGFFGSLALNFLLVAGLITIMPLKEVRPYLVSVAEEGSILATVKPLNTELQGAQLIIESLVRTYVKQRYEVLRSKSLMTERWAPGGYIDRHSEGSEYKRFMERAREALTTILDNDGQRTVDIKSVSKYQGAYLVDYTATTYDAADRAISKRDYSAVLELEFRKQESLDINERYINPTGFTIVSAQITEKQD